MSCLQLPLPWHWPRRQCFERFLADPVRDEALAQVRRLAVTFHAPWVLLTGPVGSGKTHLLIAACRQVVELGGRVQYLPLRRLAPRTLADWMPQLPGDALLAMDDLETVVGHAGVEHALFGLYDRLRAQGGRLLLSSAVPSAALGIVLPDLRSRISACTLATLRTPGDGLRREILLNEANQRGIVLDEPVLDWLFTRHSRDLSVLLALLERLDYASLAERRRVTIPFLRELLKDES